jgi:hypothetical protein
MEKTMSQTIADTLRKRAIDTKETSYKEAMSYMHGVDDGVDLAIRVVEEMLSNGTSRVETGPRFVTKP